MYLGLFQAYERGFRSVLTFELGHTFKHAVEATRLGVQVLDTGVAQVGARGVADNKVPAQVLDVGGVSLEMGCVR